MREHFNSFVAEHPDGKMGKSEFKEMMRKVGEVHSLGMPDPQALPKQDADKMEKHMFRVYDANDDGRVDFVEFMVSSS